MSKARCLRMAVASAIAVSCSLATSSPYAFAGSRGSDEEFLVSVFDCYVPMPTDIVLNSHETRHFAFFRRSPWDSTRIVIGAYRGSLDDVYEIVDSEDREGLTIETLRYRDSSAATIQENSVARIHDRKQAIRIYGPRQELVDYLVHGCLERKRAVVNQGVASSAAKPQEAERTGRGQGIQMLVFGCYMPIPGNYVLNTRERDRIRLFEKGGSGQIIVSEYREFHEPYEVIATEKMGPLTVLGVRYTGTVIESDSNVRRFIVVHDGEDSIRVHGDESFVDQMIQHCLSNPASVAGK